MRQCFILILFKTMNTKCHYKSTMKLNIPNDDGVGLLLENINSTKNRMELQLKAKRNGKNLQY